MNIVEVKPMSVVERAANALSKADVEARIKELVKESSDIVAVTDPASREACHSRLMVLKNMRVQTQTAAKDGRDEAVKYSKAVIAIEKELVALIEPEEARLANLRDGWDSKIAAEKQAKIEAEVARVTEIQRRTDGIRNWPLNAANQPSLLVGQMLAQARAYRIEPEVFEEYAETAAAVLAASVAALAGILETCKQREEAEEQLRRDQAELAERRRADADRQRIADEDRRKQEAADKVARDAEAATQREQLLAARKKLADEQAENDRIARERQADLDRQAEEQRQANAVEAGKIAAQRAELEREQAKLREAQAPKPEPVPAAVALAIAIKPRAKALPMPPRSQMIDAVEDHFLVDRATALYWLLSFTSYEVEACQI